jgi:DNA integrity scanning protein DisA with diadenylate cyclase activity
VKTPDDVDLFSDVCTGERGIDLQTPEQTIRLAVEIAREGREGRKVGTMLILDLKGLHSTGARDPMAMPGKKGKKQEPK